MLLYGHVGEGDAMADEDTGEDIQLPKGIQERLRQMEQRHAELEKLLGDAEVISKPGLYRTTVKEHGRLSKRVGEYRRLQELEGEMASTSVLMAEESDVEMRKLAEEELAALRTKRAALIEAIQEGFLSEDEDADRNAIMEIRAGTGGEEAALFARDLFDMYGHYAEGRGWRVEVMDSSPTDLGGFKEIVFQVSGDDVYSQLRYESGGHRVQRVPKTEGSGRIHTSAATVAVLPEVEDVEVEIKEADLEIDRMRSSGPGGQSVNKTSSAVRIHHKPTGLIVHCQENTSQYKNLDRAMRILRSRLYDMKMMEQRTKRETMRRSQIGSGDRSQRIRTYNFPQDRLTDHRINESIFGLDRVMEGHIEELIEKLKAHDRAQRLASL